jgi:plastocyanin
MRVGWITVVFVAVAVAVTNGAAATTAEITMPGKLFAPRELDVLVGATITWRNTDHSTHTVTEDDDVFDSGHIRPGGEFAQAFTKTGRFEFHCTIHRFMRGSVSVFEVVLRGPEDPLPAGRRATLEGVAPAGVEEVALERLRPAPSETVTVVETDAEGAFRFVVRAPEPRLYRVRAGSATSPRVSVRVSPRVSIAARGGGVVVRAVPARPGSRVLLQRYSRELFAFVTVARSRLDSTSRVAIPYRPADSEHVRAVVVGKDGWSDGASRPLVVMPG